MNSMYIYIPYTRGWRMVSQHHAEQMDGH